MGRDPAKARAWRRRSGPVKAISDARRAGSPDRRAVVARAFDAAGHRCVMVGYSRCFGELTPHRIRKGSAGWDRTTAGYVDGNVVALCAHHNGLLEDEPALATTLGLVAR